MPCSPPFGASLPGGWPSRVRSAAIHAMSLAHATLTASRGWAANHWNARFRIKAENERLNQEISLLLEELRIKNERMLRIPAHQRPHYQPVERMAILELRALRGWSVVQAAERFQLTTNTLSSWMKRLNEEGEAALVRLPVPVNKFPEFVGYMVRRFKVTCPNLGYTKLAQFLCRAGLHLGDTTIRRMILAKPSPKKERPVAKSKGKTVIARYPSHVWHADLSVVPTSLGFWTSALPFSWPQCWPFCWWIAVIADQFSKRIMGVERYRKQPTSRAVRGFLSRVFREAKVRPRHLITDQGRQFRADSFQAWIKRLGIKQRFGAIGKYGSIAFVERLIQTLKRDCTRRLIVPYSDAAMKTELLPFQSWYNRYRPHETLRGAGPDEVYARVAAACAKPRFEPRGKWPARSPCAAPRAKIDGRRGARLELHVSYVEGRRHMPIVELERVA